jgi:hypothetical protein
MVEKSVASRLLFRYTSDMVQKLEAPVLDRILDPVARTLTPSVARRIADLRADPHVQAHIDELAAKANEGQLSAAERTEYEAYVTAIDFIAVLQSKARAFLASSSS